MKRAKMREKLFQFLYQIQINKTDTLKNMADYFLLNLDEEFLENDIKYFELMLKNYVEQVEIIDAEISGYLRGWTLDRISKIDLALLRLAFLELKTQKETPPKVVASEIVLLCKKYSEERSKQYINGILGELIKNIDTSAVAENSD